MSRIMTVVSGGGKSCYGSNTMLIVRARNPRTVYEKEST